MESQRHKDTSSVCTELATQSHVATIEAFTHEAHPDIASLATSHSTNPIQAGHSELQYLHNLLSRWFSSSAMSLRSSTHPQFEIHRPRTVYGSRAFRVAASKTCSNLPAELMLLLVTLSSHFTNTLNSFLFAEGVTDS